MNEEIEELEYTSEIEELVTKVDDDIDMKENESYNNSEETYKSTNMNQETLEEKNYGFNNLNNNSFMEEPFTPKSEYHMEKNIDSSEKHYKSNGSYVSYEKRILIKIIIALLFFIVACVFLGKALKTDDVNITYDEKSNVNYNVCFIKNEHYKEECAEPNMEYISTITKSIPITFNYQANYSSVIEYNYNYYVMAAIKIYNPDSEDKVLYKSDEKLTKVKNINKTSDKITLNESIDVPFAKYNDYVNEYKSKYFLNTNATLEISLYLEDENKVSRKVSGVVVPLSKQTFSITKNEATNSNIPAVSVKKSWKNENFIFAIIAVVFSLIGVIITIRIMYLIFKTFRKKSKYEIKLDQILKEYDRIIVRINDKESFIHDKQEIKVYDFLELLDARDTLERPIIYIKVNNIKSEFYVEDLTRVYKYVMKESDFEDSESKKGSN